MATDISQHLKAFSKNRIGMTAVAMVLGAISVFGFAKWQDQQGKIDDLTTILAQLQRGTPQTLPTGPEQSPNGVVSRNAVADLTSIGGVSTPVDEFSGAQRLEQLMAETGIVFEPSDLCFDDGTHDLAP